MLLVFNGRGVLQLSVIKYFVFEVISQKTINHYMEIFFCMNSSHTGELTRAQMYDCYKMMGFKSVEMFNIDQIFA